MRKDGSGFFHPNAEQATPLVPRPTERLRTALPAIPGDDAAVLFD